MAGVCFFCACVILMIPLFLWLISSAFSLFSSFPSVFSFIFAFFAQSFSWITIFFVKYILATLILFVTSYYFLSDFIKKLEIHNKTRKKLNEQNKNLQLSDFISAMREMRQTVFYIVTFFFALEISNYFVFSNNLVYQLIFYLNLTLIMTLVLEMLGEGGNLMEVTRGRDGTERQVRAVIDFVAVLMGSVMVGETVRMLFDLIMR